VALAVYLHTGLCGDWNLMDRETEDDLRFLNDMMNRTPAQRREACLAAGFDEAAIHQFECLISYFQGLVDTR
jgi:hypothetical protein